MTTEPTSPSSPIQWESRISDNGDVKIRLDADSTLAVQGGYDALRFAKSSAGVEGWDSAERAAHAIVAVCKPRASEASRHLITEAASLAASARDGRSRQVAAALVKAALRAQRVALAR